jgi:hypothetical protein
MRFRLSLRLLLTVVWFSRLGLAASPDEWSVKRKEVFEFSEKPVVTREGDKVTISFAAKDFCDATVAIENSQGRILRFLACGVLGTNAPAPFQKGTLSQKLVWDGKNEKDEYVDNKEELVVRVSLGLKPRYERRLNWSPYKKSSYEVPAILCPTPEGVYYFENGGPGHERLMLFDHRGDYVRTIYPFAAEKLAKVDGLLWRQMPQTGERVPLRNGLSQASLLSTGDRDYNVKWPTPGANSALALAVRDARILLAGERLNRLATDGSSGGVSLQGADVFVPVFVPNIHSWKGGVINAAPTEMAISPDGKWVYLAGYSWTRSWKHGGLCGVGRVAIDGSGPVENFAGDLAAVALDGKVEKDFVEALKPRDRDGTAIKMAASVDVDPQGRVYVADNRGDKVLVFDAAGKPLKSIPVKRPAVVRVHPKTGEIYVFSFTLIRVHQDAADVVAPMFHRFGAVDNPALQASIPLDVGDVGEVFEDGPATRVAVDFWAEQPTIWVARPGHGLMYGTTDWTKNGVVILTERNGKLVTLRDFPQESLKATQLFLEPRLSRPRIYFNPGNRKVYAAEPDNPCIVYKKKEFRRATLINPETGRVERMEELPFSAEDMAFDQDGTAYLRTKDIVVRYDSQTWREIPFDYGVDKEAVAHTDVKIGSAISGIDLPSQLAGGWWHMGGMSVSTRGHIAVTCYNTTPVATGVGSEKFVAAKNTKKYSPKLFPGREPNWCVHVFDKRGRLLIEDAIPGSTQLAGIGIDRDDNLYAMTLGQRVYNGKAYDNIISCMAFKARPKVTKVLCAGRQPIPLVPETQPHRDPDIHGGPYGAGWFENAEWFYGGVGSAAKFLPCFGGGCWCEHSGMMLDEYARSFIPENDTYRIAVLDANGNLIVRIGRYGNVDDGLPLVKEGGPANPRAIGGDEVALFLPRFCATETDRRLFVTDAGHGCSISAVKLGYHVEERVALKDVSDQKKP